MGALLTVGLTSIQLYLFFEWLEQRVLSGSGALARSQALFFLFLCALFVILLAHAPIAQVASYHDFADARTILGIPNFWNLVSNAPFLVVGLLGLREVLRRPPAAALEWMTCFGGVTLVVFGSSYYHWAPSDATLLWDRIPIGIAFAGFFCALVAEHVSASAGRWLLAPALIFAMASIFWWHSTRDLFPWVFVQVGPMLAIVLVFALFPIQGADRRYLPLALAWYVAAKVLELGDAVLMQWTAGFMGGHALKHFAAATGVYCFYAMLVRRERGG